ncbi:MAG: PQQ-binding-like beta-propeller repeat protein, partial [Candidatus Brocadiae bacterium]|nr:PQQ-binding-like beta-propeller repeat protein [Candidatus Brocadiia bacterium]
TEPLKPGQADRHVSSRIRLPVDPDAEGDLEAAGRLIQKHQWERALPILQALLDKRGNELAWNGEAYVPVADLVNERMASLSAEARRVYALLHDAACRKIYQQGVARRSPKLLKQAATRYLNATDGPRALSALASLLMDDGEFDAALLLLRRTDKLHLDAATAGHIAAKKLICLARLNRREEAERLVAALKGSGTDHVTANGEERECNAFMEEAFARFSTPGRPAEHDAWPSLGGNPAGNAPPPSPAPEGLWGLTVELPWPHRVKPKWPSLPSTRPVAGQDAVFINRDGVVVAVDRKSPGVAWIPSSPGTALGLALLRGEGDDAEPLSDYYPVGNIHHWRTFDNHGLATLSLHGGRLFAVHFDPMKLLLPGKPWQATPEELALANELRCYEAASGALLWRAGAGTRRLPALSDCWFFTAPTVHGERAYVLAARTGRLHALCLDAVTGQLLWDTPIGALESRQEIQRFSMEFFLADTSPPAVSDGVVVYPTGQGVVCAYSAHNGDLLWVSPYPRSAERIHRLGQRIDVPSSSWVPRQPIIRDGRCLLTPMDSRRLVALSLFTGAPIWQARFPNG